MMSARRYSRNPWLASYSLYSFATVAWMSAARAIVSSTRIGMSQIRNSMVLKNGGGRISHQIFFALSIQPVLISSLLKFSYSPPLGKESGIFVCGNLSNTLQRYDFNPLFIPSQNGEFVDNARMCGTK